MSDCSMVLTVARCNVKSTDSKQPKQMEDYSEAFADACNWTNQNTACAKLMK
ncbi:MAG: hypothetical protein AAGG66_07020 [Methanothrix soehngenii]|uniref:hypothetical protein n=1 Tax=Methanothrix soehngenii TaxID=2223 RepID=UPI003141A9BE